MLSHSISLQAPSPPSAPRNLHTEIHRSLSYPSSNPGPQYCLNLKRYLQRKGVDLVPSLSVPISNRKKSKVVPIRASADQSSMGETVVDHLVYFKVKSDASPETISLMLIKLQELEKLDSVIQLVVGEAFYSTGGWTHALFGRYRDKSALRAYTVSPEHLDVVKNYVRPIAEDILAVDWEIELQSNPFLPDLNIVHSVIMQPKESASETEVAATFQALREQERTIPKLLQVSLGINFSNRSKGFEWGYLALFESKQDFEAYDSHPEHKNVVQNSVFPLIDKHNRVGFSKVITPLAPKI